MNEVAIDIPGLREIPFLRWRPPDPGDSPNIVLVDASGTVVRVRRRLIPGDMGRAEAAVRGAASFAEIQERLERLLPELPADRP